MFLHLQHGPLDSHRSDLHFSQRIQLYQGQSLRRVVDYLPGLQRSSRRLNDEEFSHLYLTFFVELAQNAAHSHNDCSFHNFSILNCSHLLHDLLGFGISLPVSRRAKKEDESQIIKSF